MTPSLYDRSIDILIRNQLPNGAFLACPNFGPYQYSWFRDGSFNSYALDLAGYPQHAGRFHAWCARIVLRYQEKIKRSIRRVETQAPLTEAVYFHCRFTAEGEEVDGHWGNHQLDGLGTWLWSLEQHLAITNPLSIDPAIAQAADLVADYLCSLWQVPCSDCWEENETQIHPYTLAAVHAGLKAHSKLRGNLHSGLAAQAIRDFLLERMESRGYFSKSLDNPAIDASLLGVAVPYGVVGPGSQLFQKTLERIEADLVSPDGGVHRYQKDTYYGGGEWILLSAWYGWIKLCLGEVAAAQRIAVWIEGQADPAGNLPEQVNHWLNQPDMWPEWVQRWGPPARPLLWSHAMYVILGSVLKKKT